MKLEVFIEWLEQQSEETIGKCNDTAFTMSRLYRRAEKEQDKMIYVHRNVVATDPDLIDDYIHDDLSSERNGYPSDELKEAMWEDVEKYPYSESELLDWIHKGYKYLFIEEAK